MEMEKVTYDSIRKAVKEKEGEFEIQQLSGVAFAVGRIWEEGEEGKREVAEIVERMAERTVKNVTSLTKADIFNFLMLFLSLNISSTSSVTVLKSYALALSNFTLNPEETEKAISLFSELNYKEKPFYNQMVQKLFQFPEISVETAVNSIFSLSKAMPEDINSLRGLLKVKNNYNCTFRKRVLLKKIMITNLIAYMKIENRIHKNIKIAILFKILDYFTPINKFNLGFPFKFQ